MNISIQSITAKNYGPFEEIHLPLKQMNGIFLLEGHDIDRGPDAQNGVGKSMVYDPIAYGLMGRSLESSGQSSEARKKLDDLASEFPDDKKKRPMLVEAVLSDLRIERGLKPKMFEVYRRAEDGTEVKRTTTFSQDSLEEYWGLNWQSFQFAMRFGGGETGLKGYNSADAEFHRKIQDTLVQADRITRCLKTTRAKIVDLNKNRLGIERDMVAAIEKADGLVSEIEDLEKREEEALYKVRDTISQLEKKLSVAKSIDMDKIEPLSRRYTELSDLVKKRHVDLDVAESDVVSAKAKMASLKEKIESYENRIQDLRDTSLTLETEVARLQSDTKSSQIDLESARGRFMAFKGMIAQKDKLTAKLTACNERIQSLQIEIDQYKRTLSNPLPARPEDSEQLTRHVKELDIKTSTLHHEAEALGKNVLDAGDPESNIRFINAEIESLDSQIAVEISHIDTIDAEITNIRELKPGTKCPTCLGDITSGHVDDAVAIINGRKVPVNVKLSSLRVKLGEAQSKKETEDGAKQRLSELKSNFDKKNREVKSSEQELRSTRERMDQARSLKIIYDQETAARSQATSMLDHSEMNLVHSKSEISETKEALSDLGLPEEDLEHIITQAQSKYDETTQRLQSKMDEQSRTSGQIQALRTSVDETLSEASDASVDSKAKKTAFQAIVSEVTSMDEELSALLDDDGNPPMPLHELLTLKSVVDDCNRRIKELKEQEIDGVYSELIKGKRSALKDANSNRKSVSAKVKTIDDTIPYLKFWEQGFGNEGIRPMAMREMLPILNAQLIRYMSMLKGQQVAIEFDDQLDLVYSDWDSGVKKHYSRCSSGMKMRINISVALAFRETISISSGCRLPVFVSDESADSLDRLGMEGYADCLEEISQDGTVIVITHNKFMTDCITARASGKMIVSHENYRSQLHIE